MYMMEKIISCKKKLTCFFLGKSQASRSSSSKDKHTLPAWDLPTEPRSAVGSAAPFRALLASLDRLEELLGKLRVFCVEALGSNGLPSTCNSEGITGMITAVWYHRTPIY